MRKNFAILSVIAILLCCLSSCSNNKATESSSTQPTTTVSDGVHFGTVSDLLTAIKHNPHNFVDKEIQVKGTFYKQESETILFDYLETSVKPNGLMDRYYFRQAANTNPSICIIIPDEILYTVAEDGDYMTVFGTVKISDGKIYLKNNYGLQEVEIN